MTHTLAILGIDGSGKSSVAAQLQQQVQAAGSSFAVMTCPQYHRTVGILHRPLSEALEALNQIGDEWGSFELKGAALFLQMTLFGPIQQQIQTMQQPNLLVSERHALIDTLVYSGFYTRMVKQDLDPAVLEPRLRERLGDQFSLITDWIDAENQRLGREISLWNLATYVRDLCGQPFPALMQELGRQFQTPLPDVAVFIDIAPEVAAARIAARGEQQELHEQLAVLQQLQQGYLKLLQALDVAIPNLQVLIVPGDNDSTPEQLAGKIYHQISA